MEVFILSNAQKITKTASKAVRVKLKRSSKNPSLRKMLELLPDERTQHERSYGLTLCRLYTSTEVCEVLRISPDCFRRMCNAGILRYHDVGRKKLVQGCEIVKYLQNSLK